jgi:hypothetical protein
MAYGTINIRLRPIKFAFLVDPTNKAAILEAIQINTFLWGGMYNPIIPVFKRTPKVWQDKPFKNPKPKNILEGYLDAFDPDIVVPIGKCTQNTFNIENRKLIPSSEFLMGIEKDYTPKYGIGIFEILKYFISKELKFIRREPFDFVLPDFKKGHSLFLASIFGALPQNIDKIFNEDFADTLGVKRVICSINNYAEFFATQKLFLRRISSLYLKSMRIRGWDGGQCIFYLDASNPLDIIDYWNLRAVGWIVVPVAKQSAGCDSTKRLVLNFIEDNFYPYRENPDFYHNATLIKSRSMSETELKDFADSLKLPPPDNKKGWSRISLQRWYPRIWDEWARDKDNVECCELKSLETQHDLSEYQERISFRTLDPEFINRFGGHGEARFANEIELRFYGDKELLAEVIPESDENLIRALGGIGFDEWRFSRKNIVYLSRHINWHIHLSIPKAEAVFSEWLNSQKWKTELSAPGRIAKQMIKQLGGVWGISLLAKEGIIKLLETMVGGKTIKEEAIWAEIQKITNQERLFRDDPNKFLQRLLDVHMLRLGIEVQCPICTQHSWYSIKDVDYELQCSNCTERFQIPSHTPKELKWSYRTFGPFSLPHQAHGVFAVLLTLRFFSQLLDGATTPLMSFVAKKDNKQIEADLGLLFQESRFGYKKTELIFAECKTYNHFGKKDTDRMILLADQFPGAFLVFATLRRSLTQKEKKLLRPVVNRGRKYWTDERPYNPVLILTGTELFSNWRPPQCWKDAGGIHAPFAQKYKYLRNLFELCDATQQLYLDMKPWHEWLKERWDKRRRKRSEVLTNVKLRGQNSIE